MGRSEFKRSLFFLLDRLRLPKQERMALMTVFFFVGITVMVNLLIQEQKVAAPENHEQLLDEFERKSEAIRQKQLEQEAIYAGQPLPSHEESTVITPSSGLVNINTAGSEELQTLPGIGSIYAERIIAYRQQHGSFQSVDELLKIRGIGEKTLEKLKPLIGI